jgi:hypothetical protein
MSLLKIQGSFQTENKTFCVEYEAIEITTCMGKWHPMGDPGMKIASAASLT